MTAHAAQPRDVAGLSLVAPLIVIASTPGQGPATCGHPQRVIASLPARPLDAVHPGGAYVVCRDCLAHVLVSPPLARDVAESSLLANPPGRFAIDAIVYETDDDE